MNDILEFTIFLLIFKTLLSNIRFFIVYFFDNKNDEWSVRPIKE